MRSLLGSALLVMALAFSQGCGEPPSPEPKGYVSGLNPPQGWAGTLVTITGGTLENAGKALGPGDREMEVTHWSPNTVVVKIPADIEPGPTEIRLVVQGHVVGSATVRVVAKPPELTAAEPPVGTVGATVTLTGRRLGAGPAHGKVFVHGAPATGIVGWKDTRITFKVPPLTEAQGAHSVWVEGEGGRSNSLDFAILTPFARDLVPDPAPPGKVARIRGRDFGTSKGQVLFGPAKTPAEIVEWADKEIRVRIPAGLSGEVQFRVVNQNGPSIPVVATVLANPDTGKMSNGPAQQVSLALDETDLPHIVTFNPKGNQLSMMKWGVGGWQTRRVLVQMGTTTGELPKPAPDLEEKIKAVIAEGQKKKLDQKTLQAQVEKLGVEAQKSLTNTRYAITAAGYHPRLVIDDRRRLHLSMYDSLAQKIVYGVRALDEEEWTFRTVAAAPGAKEGMFSDIAVDRHGTAHVVYMDEASHQVRVASTRGDAFVEAVVDPARDVGLAPSLAVDAQLGAQLGAHVAYLDFGQFDLKYAGGRAGKFTPERVDAPGWTGDMPSLVLDEAGRPVIAYVKRDDQGMIPMGVRLATRSGAGWKIETVEEAPGLGVNPILRRDRKGRYHLLFIDQKRKGFRYYVRTGLTGPWKGEPIAADVQGEMQPQAASMTIGSDDLARVVYVTTGFQLYYRILYAP